MYFQFDLPFCNKILQSVEIQNAKDILWIIHQILNGIRILFKSDRKDH